MADYRHAEARKVVAPVPKVGRNVIAVVGIDRYPHWPVLSNAVNDATGTLQTFLGLGYVALTKHLYDEAATAEAIRSLIVDELRSLEENDSLVLFFAGHGHTETQQLPGGDIVKTGYLVPFDGEALGQRRFSSFLRLDGVLEEVSRLPARHILVIIDACYAGIALGSLVKWRNAQPYPLDQGALRALRRKRSRRVITSALDDQPALDSGPVPAHSLFTGILIDVLRNASTQLGGRTFVTGSELGLLMQQRVSAWPGSRQTPDFGALALDDRGEMLIPLGASDIPDTTALEPLLSRRASVARRAAIPGVALLATATVLTWVAARSGCDPRTVRPDGGRELPADAGGEDASPAVAWDWPSPTLQVNPWIALPGQGVEMQQHEVTRAEYVAYLAARKPRMPEPPWGGRRKLPPDEELLPATGMSRDEAVAYCQSIDGWLPSIRLWESEALKVPALPPDFAVCRDPLEVGKSAEPTSPLGFRDLVSNVYEFLSDRDEQGRWLLGGFPCALDLDDIQSELAHRRWHASTSMTSKFYGFRCVRDHR